MRGNAAVERRPLPSATRARGTLGRLPLRATEKRFWITQGLLGVSVGMHYAVEIAGVTNPFETLHGLSITLFVIPMLYASLSFGWEGAILTALWGALLTTPSMFVWHQSQYHWLTEVAQLLVTLPVGLLVAWRVDRETRLREAAERTSASLDILNRVGLALRHTLEVEREIPSLLPMLRRHLGLDAAWIVLTPPADGSPPRFHADAMQEVAEGLEARALALHAVLTSDDGEHASSGSYEAIPLRGEHEIEGSLGWRAGAGFGAGAEQDHLRATLANQIAVALQNARLTRERQRGLRSYVRIVTQAQEDERLRIARELHDDTAQQLIHIVRSIEEVAEGRGSAAERELAAIANVTRDTLHSVRRFARDLRPSVLDDLGLVAAMETTFVEGREHPVPEVSLEVTGDEQRLDRSVELALFRIAQEAVRNTEKHSGASHVRLSLHYNPTDVRLQVLDDGNGFDPSSSYQERLASGHFGLVGMSERAELAGGTFTVDSKPGEGTLVTVTVPRTRPG